MPVTLVGSIMAPSLAFAMLEKELKKRGVEVRALLGNGKPVGLSAREVKEFVAGSDVVLLGMSVPGEFAREEHWAAFGALDKGIPLGLYADTYGVFRRPWFRYTRKEASFLFVPDEEEAKEARPELGPESKTEVIASGNPTWEDFFSPNFTREGVRKGLSINGNETAVLCSIGTVLEPNKVMLEAVDRAMDASNLNAKLIVCIHPGDQHFKENPGVYNDLINAMSTPSLLVTMDFMPTMDVVAGMDLVIDTPGSSIGICAACQRVPVVCYCSKEALASLEEAITTRVWKPCERGVMLPIYDLSELKAMPNQNLSAMVERQKRIFPAPTEKGRAVRIMADTLTKYAKK